MINYDKSEIRKQLTIEQVFELCVEWGGDPTWTDFGFISGTICHNHPGEGSKKLYYYRNTGLFQCYSNCGSFDPFDLLIKVAKIQWNKDYDLNDAVRYIAIRFGYLDEVKDIDRPDGKDWEKFNSYDRFEGIDIKDYHVRLKEYDNTILDNLKYDVIIKPWLDEGITQNVLDKAKIGYYPGGGQITIPHFDADGRFIGLRGRDLCEADAKLYGKYRPLVVGWQQYNHPLGMNLYGLNWNKEAISILHTAIIFESEKSVLKYGSYFGIENNISVACCGSNISFYQIQALLDAGANEIIIAFDRQYKEIGDDEYKKWVNKLIGLSNKYSNYCKISFIFDTGHLLGYKDSPIDCGPEIFMELFRKRLDKDGK